MVSEMFFMVISFVWVIGWIKELAYIGAKMNQFNIDYPNKGVKYMMPIVLFFTWPYFYFYGKAL